MKLIRPTDGQTAALMIQDYENSVRAGIHEGLAGTVRRMEVDLAALSMHHLSMPNLRRMPEQPPLVLSARKDALDIEHEDADQDEEIDMAKDEVDEKNVIYYGAGAG